jgi:hypothetical protein
METGMLTLVYDPDLSYEWLYVDGEQVATGEPIDASEWLRVLRKLSREGKVYHSERMELTSEFCERVDGNLNLIPSRLEDFHEDLV